MAANPNWARWMFASIAYVMKTLATSNSIPVIVEGMDDETDTFTEATDRVEIRISGPYTRALSGGEYRIYMDVNILLTSRFDGAGKNRHTILKNVGLFQEKLDSPISVYRYGSEAGDDDSFLGCLMPRKGKNDTVRVLHFGKIDPTDKVRQSMVDARYEMYLSP